MQAVTRMRSRLVGARPGQPSESALRRRELRLGLLGLFAVVVVFAAAGVLYVVPPGQQHFSAVLSEAQSVRVGDDVRLAGIPVGKVGDLELRPDKVLMRFTVKSGIFLGDQTSLDVRMLTVVGGHYVAVVPAGTAPLGKGVIPAERVRLPYSLMQTFQDAEQPVRAVDGNTLRRNIDDMTSALESAPDSLRRTIDGIEQFVDVLDRQRSDVSKAIAITDEYMKSIDAARGHLHRLIDKVNLLETLLVDHRAELREAVRALDRVVNRIGGVAPSWNSTLNPLAQQLSAAAQQLMALGDKLGPLIDQVAELGRNLQPLVLPDGRVSVDQSNKSVDGTGVVDSAALADDVCVPVPGKAC
ncbi:Mce family protein MceC [Nocardia nova SH22a]|uniref:Mce family protein MceC n=1 Tax=Nocardia nova SH22a TaxID=1415166 RepID=W5TLY6_9NOCA|nr:MlaD family protein [Nocardia nova]AHH19973.1 Mce family protein MceC [Nocardia nova SH22a]